MAWWSTGTTSTNQHICVNCNNAYPAGTSHVCPTYLQPTPGMGGSWGQLTTGAGWVTTARGTSAVWPTTATLAATLRYTKLTVLPDCVVLEGEHGFPRMEIALDVLRQLLDWPTIEAKATMEALAK